MHAAPLDPLHATATELRVLVGRLRRRLREEARTGDLSLSQFAVLGHLGRDGPATVSDLARAEGMRPQSMSAVVASLQATGLVHGTPDPGDGRRTLLALTEAARVRVRASRAAREDWLLQVLRERFSREEQALLAHGLELLQRIADA